MQPSSDGTTVDGSGLDFTRPFLPEPLALTGSLEYLSPVERLTLNQVRGHSYLGLLELLEDALLPLALERASPRRSGDAAALRALRQRASQKASHVQRFRGFRERFRRGFGSPCEVVGPPGALSLTWPAGDCLAVALATLHAECMTGRHHCGAADASGRLDPRWGSLIEQHGKEEASHARLDALLVGVLAEERSPSEVDRSVGQYLVLVDLLDGILEEQVHRDVQCLARAIGRELTGTERDDLLAVQRRATRWTYLVSGLTDPGFLCSLEGLGPSAKERALDAAAAYR